jgi:hypothetical protein
MTSIITSIKSLFGGSKPPEKDTGLEALKRASTQLSTCNQPVDQQALEDLGLRQARLRARLSISKSLSPSLRADIEKTIKTTEALLSAPPAPPPTPKLARKIADPKDPIFSLVASHLKWCTEPRTRKPLVESPLTPAQWKEVREKYSGSSSPAHTKPLSLQEPRQPESLLKNNAVVAFISKELSLLPIGRDTPITDEEWSEAQTTYEHLVVLAKEKEKHRLECLKIVREKIAELKKMKQLTEQALAVIHQRINNRICTAASTPLAAGLCLGLATAYQIRFGNDESTSINENVNK